MNGKLVLYVENRDIVIGDSHESAMIRGVIAADNDFIRERALHGQLVLLFRYGREDEEVMGLTFCNAVTLKSIQFYPTKSAPSPTHTTAIQRVIREHLSAYGVAHTFNLQVSEHAPPSVMLYPARGYRGAPLGTSYELHFYASDVDCNKITRRSSVKMIIRVRQKDLLPLGLKPEGSMSKQFLWSTGLVHASVYLEKDVFYQSEPIKFHVVVLNGSSRQVRKIRAEVVQWVNVSMFKSAKFKSVVAQEEWRPEIPLSSNSSCHRDFSLEVGLSSFKNWLAMDCGELTDGQLSISLYDCHEDWRNFSVQVSYSVRVKVFMTGLGGSAVVYVPFARGRDPVTDTSSNSTMAHGSFSNSLPLLSTPSPKSLSTSVSTRQLDECNILAESSQLEIQPLPSTEEPTSSDVDICTDSGFTTHSYKISDV